MHINLAENVKRITGSRQFRECWQVERSILEGDQGSSFNLDLIEDYFYSHGIRSKQQNTQPTTELITDPNGHKSLYDVLRLLCLQSLTADGIRASRYDNMRRLIIQTYGFKYINTFRNLEIAGNIFK